MFKKATRRDIHLKLAITGPSGSGKTYSALQLAFGLGKRVALVDTENSSASLYCDLGDFDTLELSPPFTTQKYTDAVNQAVKGGYEVLIIDSLSHAWAGEGGLLAQKESLDSRGGNSFSNWAQISRQHEQLKSVILQAPIHTIVTMRSKQDYILTEQNGKQVPQKVGLAPVQRDGIEYEFTVVWDIAMNHEAQASKDRTGLFDGNIARLASEHGAMLLNWLGKADKSKVVPVSTAQLVDVLRIVDKEVQGEMVSLLVTRNAVYQVEQLRENDREFIERAERIHIEGVDTGKTVKCGEERLPLLNVIRWEIPRVEVSSNGSK